VLFILLLPLSRMSIQVFSQQNSFQFQQFSSYQYDQPTCQQQVFFSPSHQRPTILFESQQQHNKQTVSLQTPSSRKTYQDFQNIPNNNNNNNQNKSFQDLIKYNRPDSKGFYPLHQACYSSNLQYTLFLLQHGAFINARDSEGNTPLIWSLRNCSPSTVLIVDTLLKAGANPNLQNRAGQTALHVSIASILSQTELFQQAEAIINNLLAFGANPNIQTLEGETPLHYAVIRSNGNNFEEEKADGNNPTTTSSFSSAFNRILENLVKNGSSVHAIDHEGDTPLHYAVREQNLLAVKALLRLGSNPDTPNEDGETPLHLASCLEFHAITSLLEESILEEEKDDEDEEEDNEMVDGNPHNQFKVIEFTPAKVYSELSSPFVDPSLDKIQANFNRMMQQAPPQEATFHDHLNSPQLFAH